MSWYKAGTVSITAGSNAVIGAGTAFIANVRVGDAFRGPDGAWYEINNVASDTALSIATGYLGATVAGGAYSIIPVQGYVKDSADQLRAATKALGDMPVSKQDKSDNLAAFSGLAGAADRLPFFTGLGALSLAVISAKARAFLGRSDSAGMRSEIGVDVTMASAVLDPQSAGGLMSSSNVNGWVIEKFLNGSANMLGTVSRSAVLPANTVSTHNFTIPSLFVNESITIPSVCILATVNADITLMSAFATGGTTNIALQIKNGPSAQAVDVRAKISGRWK